MVHLGDIIQTYIAPTIPFGPDPFLPNRLSGPGPEFGPVPDRVQNLGPLQSDGPTAFLLYKSYSLAVGDILPFVPILQQDEAI